MLEIITRKGWLGSISQTDEDVEYGTAYAIVKSYTKTRDQARQDTTNLEIVVRRPDGRQALVYVLADNDGFVYPTGTPVHVFNVDPVAPGYQIDGKAGPSGIGWRYNGDLEVSANLRIFNAGVERQAWVRVILREIDGVWREV